MCSCRFLLFNKQGEVVNSHQIEMTQIYPNPGWLEHLPSEINNLVNQCIENVMKDYKNEEVVSIGITNQRETLVVWDKITGQPLYNAIVWSDSRTTEVVNETIQQFHGDTDYFRNTCGLPISTYFSAMKFKWLMANVPEVKQAVEEKRALFGTVDTWLTWNLTGGVNGGIYTCHIHTNT